MYNSETPFENAEKILVLRVFVGETEVDQQAFTKKTVLIGRDPYSDVHLEDPMISRLHASIRRVAVGGLLFVDHSCNGTMVNGRLVDTHYLVNGDMITLGRFRVLAMVHSDVKLMNEQLVRSKISNVEDEQTIRAEKGPAI